ncbi:DNA-directed RNA polymerase, subunit 2, hybrid-binding domain [Dillenia turbinata]|uniref:DNA-directed RNA polymerase n=1 Tax=Dillenia turbinata TaxID=194707 RepID=A0AAN8UQ21_9MAGN
MGTLVKEDFGRPNREKTMGRRLGSFDKLDDDGLAPPQSLCIFKGTRVSGEDVIIGKTSPIAQDDAQGDDMPWTVEGITTDFIVNPHAVPSQMTIGQFIECIMGKVAAHTGKEGDATPFTDVTVDNISKALHKCGYQMRGFETMYNGHTGQ